MVACERADGPFVWRCAVAGSVGLRSGGEGGGGADCCKCFSEVCVQQSIGHRKEKHNIRNGFLGP